MTYSLPKKAKSERPASNKKKEAFLVRPTLALYFHTWIFATSNLEGFLLTLKGNSTQGFRNGFFLGGGTF